MLTLLFVTHLMLYEVVKTKYRYMYLVLLGGVSNEDNWQVETESASPNCAREFLKIKYTNIDKQQCQKYMQKKKTT